MAQYAPIIEFRRKVAATSRVPRIRRAQERGQPAPIAVTRADISRSHGILPSAISLDVVPLDFVDISRGGRVGDLYIEYENRSLTIPDCIIDSTSFHADTGTRVTSMVIFDRRWRWQFGDVSGHYNRTNESGDIIANNAILGVNETDSERNPQQLAQILLSLMGEQNVDLSALPTNTRPEFEWDHDLPARQLDILCDIYGCRVVLGWDNNVHIYRLGQRRRRQQVSRVPRIRRAQELADFHLPPGLPIIRASAAFNTAERPDEIEISGSPIVYQFDMPLEPVGEDVDGSIQLLRNLSYAPDRTDQFGGWYDKDLISPGTDTVIPDAAADDEEQADARHLAARSVGKWFRVQVPFTFPRRVRNPNRPAGTPPEYERPIRIRRLTQILPILPFRGSTTVQDQITVQQEAFIYGLWYDGRDNTQSLLSSLPDTVDGTERDIVPGGYRIVASKGLVIFSTPLVALDADTDKYTAPGLYLRACFNYRLGDGSFNTGVFGRTQPDPLLGTRPLVVKRPELITIYRAIYTRGELTPSRVDDNIRTVQQVAGQYIDEIEKQYENRSPFEVVYAGFYPEIDLDGKIRTVQFSMDANNRSAPITTAVYVDQDIAGFGNLTYAELKNATRIRDLAIRSRISTSVVDRRRFERNQRW